MARLQITMTALDERIERQLLKYGTAKVFLVTVWRQSANGSGCNWNARLEQRSRQTGGDTGWWQIIPDLRERFNVSDD